MLNLNSPVYSDHRRYNLFVESSCLECPNQRSVEVRNQGSRHKEHTTVVLRTISTLTGTNFFIELSIKPVVLVRKSLPRPLLYVLSSSWFSKRYSLIYPL